MSNEMNIDCQACGACCGPTYESDVYAHVTKRDRDKMPHPLRNLLVGEVARPLPLMNGNAEPDYAMRTRDVRGRCVCTALAGEIGERVSCTIYSTRPRVCREFRKGSGQCIQARAEVGLPIRDLASASASVLQITFGQDL